VASHLQEGPDLLEVINLAIEYNPDASILIALGLSSSGGEVNDREPAVAQRYLIVDIGALIIWPAVL
jgi:hypothetical protein